MRILSLYPSHSAAKRAFDDTRTAGAVHIHNSRTVLFEDSGELIRFYAVEDRRDADALSGFQFDMILGLNNIVIEELRAHIIAMLRRPLKG